MQATPAATSKYDFVIRQGQVSVEALKRVLDQVCKDYVFFKKEDGERMVGRVKLYEKRRLKNMERVFQKCGIAFVWERVGSKSRDVADFRVDFTESWCGPFSKVKATVGTGWPAVRIPNPTSVSCDQTEAICEDSVKIVSCLTFESEFHKALAAKPVVWVNDYGVSSSKQKVMATLPQPVLIVPKFKKFSLVMNHVMKFPPMRCYVVHFGTDVHANAWCSFMSGLIQLAEGAHTSRYKTRAVTDKMNVVVITNVTMPFKFQDNPKIGMYKVVHDEFYEDTM